MSSRVIKTSKQPFFRSLSFTDLFVELMQWPRIRRVARIFPEVQTISQIPLQLPAVQVPRAPLSLSVFIVYEMTLVSCNPTG